MIIKIYVSLISFKKEHLSKKVLVLLYSKQTLRLHNRLCYVIQIAFIFLSHMEEEPH